MNRILLAYSGGLETTVAIPWLREQFDAEVITMTVDLGQGLELADIHERALAAGAVRAHVVDARDEFVREYILPALQAGAVYEDRYPLATALGRPLMARRLVEIARMEGASAIAHGCTGVHNDQVRLEASIRALDPSLSVIAAAQVWTCHASNRRSSTRGSAAWRCRTPPHPPTASTRTSGVAPSPPAGSKTRGSSRPRTSIR